MRAAAEQAHGELQKPAVPLSASIKVSLMRKEGCLHFPLVEFFICERASLTSTGPLAYLTLGRAKAMDLR